MYAQLLGCELVLWIQLSPISTAHKIQVHNLPHRPPAHLQLFWHRTVDYSASGRINSREAKFTAVHLQALTKLLDLPHSLFLHSNSTTLATIYNTTLLGPDENSTGCLEEVVQLVRLQNEHSKPSQWLGRRIISVHQTTLVRHR